ncbi:MAG: hypothetical protein ACLU4N_27055 [Butyricimonas faecihominis]
MDGEFQPEWNTLFDSVDRHKMIFFCTPNNPVERFLNISEVASRLMGLSVDEAYIDLLICHRLLFYRRFAGMLSCYKLIKA